MNPLIGLRPDDLSVEERQALAVLLDEDPACLLEHEEALVLGTTLQSLNSSANAVTATQVLAKARARTPRRWWPAVAAMTMAAVALLLVGLQQNGSMRTRGVAHADPFVQLSAAAEGHALRPLANNAALLAGERVLFEVHSPPGVVTLTERSESAEELVLRWETPGGHRSLGGDTPLAWTPNQDGGGLRAYVVEWCPSEGGACVIDELTLRWP